MGGWGSLTAKRHLSPLREKRLPGPCDGGLTVLRPCLSRGSGLLPSPSREAHNMPSPLAGTASPVALWSDLWNHSGPRLRGPLREAPRGRQMRLWLGAGPHVLSLLCLCLICGVSWGRFLPPSEPHLPQQGNEFGLGFILTLPLPTSHFLPLPWGQTFTSLFSWASHPSHH